MGPIATDALQEGDILLMLGDGPLSDLIAWASDGPYSHAAMVVDGGDLLEASFAGVRRVPIAGRLQERGHYHFIDAWRPLDAQGGSCSTDDRGLVLAHAATMLGAPYPADQLALFGVVMAVRGKWPKHPLLRTLVRIALDRALPSESPGMVCSEVVYRAWAECGASPRGRLALPIVQGARGDAPFPAIDWQRLYDEISPFLLPAPTGGRLRGGAAGSAAALLEAAEAPDDEALEQARQRVLAGLDARVGARSAGVHGAGAHSAGLDGSHAYHPNPRLVSPQDLAGSPGTRPLGRLMERDRA